MCMCVAQAVGTPPLLAAIALGQLSNVMGCLSTYGIGSAPPYYGAGYVPQSKWYQLGFLLSIFYIAVWLFAGGAWWKVSPHTCLCCAAIALMHIWAVEAQTFILIG